MERILFIMPDDGEAFLAALSAVQAWIKEQDEQINVNMTNLEISEAEVDEKYNAGNISLSQQQRLLQQADMIRKGLEARQPEVHVVMDEKFNMFMPAFGDNVCFDSTCQYQKRGYFDLVHKFDIAAVYELAAPASKHMAQTFGVLLGVDAGSLPDLSHMEGAYIDFDADWTTPPVVLLDFVGQQEVVNFVRSNRPRLDVIAWPPGEYCNYGVLFNAEMVVGLQSSYTYIASALGKRVVELVRPGKHSRWLSKWDNPNYKMIYREDFPPALVYRAMDELWSRPLGTIKRKHSLDIKHKRGVLTGLSVGTVGGSI